MYLLAGQNVTYGSLEAGVRYNDAVDQPLRRRLFFYTYYIIYCEIYVRIKM